MKFYEDLKINRKLEIDKSGKDRQKPSL